MKELAIGDMRSAILALQQSQTDPQKAIAEFVENSIDAKARNIGIVRRKRGGKIDIVITDDGEGVPAGDDGNPDFDRVARSICDSIKRRLDEQVRQDVIGEFGIGILGFACVGEELEMISRNVGSQTKGFRLKAGTVEYETFDPPKMQTHGTIVTIRAVRKEIQARLTAEKLSRYLGTELRDRIRKTGVQIRVKDMLPGGKEVKVVPTEFEGQRLQGISKVHTRFGSVQFELYYPHKEGGDNRVAISRKGTRLIDDISQIAEISEKPWKEGKLLGNVRCDFLTPAPASRKGIVPDEKFEALIDAIRSVEEEVRRLVEFLDQKREEQLDKDLLRELENVFSQLIKELPAEYEWFQTETGGLLPGRPTSTGKRERPRVELSAGPLEHVQITPAIAHLSFGERKKFLARAFDPHGRLILLSDVKYFWELLSGTATLESEGRESYLTAGNEESEGRLRVRAQLGREVREHEARFLIIESPRKTGGRSLPPIQPRRDPLGDWRSRYVREENIIEYNTSHRDYLRARERGKRSCLRYLALLIAKELCLLNFSGAKEAVLLERMVEVTSTMQLFL